MEQNLQTKLQCHTIIIAILMDQIACIQVWSSSHKSRVIKMKQQTKISWVCMKLSVRTLIVTEMKLKKVRLIIVVIQLQPQLFVVKN